ncbi:MAG: HD domain-containing protein, partial [Acidobacteriota bacterium]
ESRWPHPDARLMILDIGGGSAELIASENGRMREAVSRPLGAIRLQEMFFEHDPPAAEELHRLQEYIAEKLAVPLRRFGDGKFGRMIATSATAQTVASAVHRLGRAEREEADRLRVPTAQVRKLYGKLCGRNLARRRKIQGIGPRRAEIIIPGTAVLLRVLEAWRFPAYYYSAAGVRDGIIADLAARGVGRELSQLDREQRREVEQLTRRYAVIPAHARKVAEMAHALFVSLQPLHELPPAYGKLLEAAAWLHDVGHYVNDVSHHKHSYYLVANSDIAGFTNREREFVASLCRYHRKAMPAADHGDLQALNGEEKRALGRLSALLRLADSLDRSHEQRVESIHCRIREDQVAIQLVSSQEVDLEQWAARRDGEIFRQVFGRSLAVTRAPQS